MRFVLITFALILTASAFAKGFYHVSRGDDGRWWAKDPAGQPFVPLGVDHVKYEGFCCERENFRQRYRETNDRLFGTNNIAAWRQQTFTRLRAWGFNMLGGGCKPHVLNQSLPYGHYLPMGRGFLLWSKAEDRQFVDEMPNVFSPDFERHCREVARRECATRKMDSSCFGYYLDNELHWWGKGSVSARLGLYDAARTLPETHSARRAFDAFVRTRNITDPAKPTEADRQAFVQLCVQRFFEITTRAIRAADPNHLILGVRFAGLTGAPDIVWQECGKWCDVVTLNVYPCAQLEENVMRENFREDARPLSEALAEKYRLCRRPILITEWSFPALDSGLPCTKGAGQRFRTQNERTRASELFARTVLALPFVIGYNYFMWVDQPALGISKSFAENSNYGLIRETGEPYAELTAMFTRVHRDPTALRLAAPPPPLNLAPPSLSANEMAQRAGLDRRARVLIAGNTYQITNTTGCLAKGQIGSGMLLTDLFCNGQTVGRLGGLVACDQPDGKRVWLSLGRVTDARASENGAALEVTTENPKAGFRNIYRLCAAAHGTTILCELLSCQNLGTAPLRLDSFYFLPDAPFALTSSPEPEAPNLWRPDRKAVWLDTSSDRWLGALTRAPRIRTVKFWLNQKRTFPHSDVAVRPPVNTLLAPGETFTANGTVYTLILAGTGGQSGWTTQTQPLER